MIDPAGTAAKGKEYSQIFGDIFKSEIAKRRVTDPLIKMPLLGDDRIA